MSNCRGAIPRRYRNYTCSLFGKVRPALRTNIGNVTALDDAVTAFNRTERIKGKTIIRVHPEDSGLPNAHEGAIHAPKESLDVEHDYADRFLSHH